MFESRKKWYTREVPETERNDYGEPVVTYSPVGDIYMNVSLQNHVAANPNDVAVHECTLVGVTQNKVEPGDVINNTWEVVFVNKAGRETIVFMNEVDSHVF